MNDTSRLDALRKQPKFDNINQAKTVINSTELTFKQKLEQVKALEEMSSGLEGELFGDVYSSLHLEAVTPEDVALISSE